MTNNTLKTNLANGYKINTAKTGKHWTTLVFDKTGEVIDQTHTHYKNEANHNHMIMVSHYLII